MQDIRDLINILDIKNLKELIIIGAINGITIMLVWALMAGLIILLD